MGQSLIIGLATKVGVDKEDLSKYKISIDEFQKKMNEKLLFVPDIYDIKEGKDLYYFNLKHSIISKELIPFLKELYPVLYDESINYDSILKKLKTLPANEWLSWAQTKPEEAFQLDKRGKCDTLKIDYNNFNIYYHSIILSLETGTYMEVYGRQFRFFKYTMMQTFKQYSIAGGLRVYLTG